MLISSGCCCTLTPIVYRSIGGGVGGGVKLSSGAVGPKNNSHPMIKKKEFIQFQTRSAMKSPWRFGAHIGAQTLNNQK